MTVEFFVVVKAAILIAIFVLLIALTLFAIEGVRIAIRARKIMERVEFMTDIKEWLGLIKFLNRKKK